MIVIIEGRGKEELVPDWVAVFLATYYAGSKGLLRTQLQKILYFASQKGILKDSFGPDYYGPFSINIANSTESLVNKKFLDETIEFFIEGIGYRYRLSDDGKNVVPIVREKFNQNIKGLRKIVSICKNQGTRPLSIAAKVHYILKTMRAPMNPKEIATQAKQLNWDLSADEVEAASNLLKELDLIE